MGLDRGEFVSLKQIAANGAVTTAASLAALLLSGAVAAADPPPVPIEPGVVDTAAAVEPPREEEPAPAEPAAAEPAPANDNAPPQALVDLVETAYQLPPPDLSAVPPLVDVSVPVGFGLGLPGLSAFPITVAPPPINFAPPQLPPPPPMPQWQPTFCGPGVPGFTPCV
jgi:hypothetical protein